MRARSISAALLGVAVTVTLALAPAASARQNPVVTDCSSNARLTHTYPSTELQAALQTMPATVKEYSSCYDIIEAALIKQLGQGGGNGHSSGGAGSGGSFLPTPVVVIIVLLALGGVTFGALAIRRRSGGPATEAGHEP